MRTFLGCCRRRVVPASFPVVLGDFGCDVTCQACRESSPRTRAIALGSKPPLVTRIARTGLGTRQVRTWVVKRITSLSNSFCSNVAKQVAHFCCPFYCSFKNKSAQKEQNRGTLMKRCPSAFTLPPSARKHSTRTLQSFFSNH